MSGAVAAVVAGARGLGALISAATGTATGNMTANGGLAAAFDGTTSQTLLLSAHLANSASDGTVGKDWGLGTTKSIKSALLYGPSNAGISRNNANATASVDAVLEGSDDALSWTTLATKATGTSIAAIILFVPTLITAYRHHRIRIPAFDSSSDKTAAEVQFFE